MLVLVLLLVLMLVLVLLLVVLPLLLVPLLVVDLHRSHPHLRPKQVIETEAAVEVEE